METGPLDDDEPLSPEELRELRSRIKDSESPIRYMVVNRLLPRWRLFFNVSDDTYCDQIDSGTLFKRLAYAEAIAEQLGRGKERPGLEVAKVTTKGGRIRVVRYLAKRPEQA